MIDIFKSKYEKQLEDIVNRLELNMSNNYKDNAQANLRELEEAFLEYKEKGVLRDKAVIKYQELLVKYHGMLEGFTHKDQLKNYPG